MSMKTKEKQIENMPCPACGSFVCEKLKEKHKRKGRKICCPLCYSLGKSEQCQADFEMFMKFLKRKEMIECIKLADYGSCHEIPYWYTLMIKRLEKEMKK
jgi:hypothetical protein